MSHLNPNLAPPFRPSPTRSATTGASPYFKSRAASQPAGERSPAPPGLGGSQPDSGRGSPAGMFGVIGGSRTPSRFGSLPSGTATRANSFSAGEVRDTKTVTRTLSSHIEEHPSRSQTTSPFPTFSPSSSVSTSPTSHLPMPLPNSPPRAGANSSRSRSQSLAVGARPIGIGRGWMTSLDQGGAFPRSFDPGWDEGSNMSPFTRNISTMGQFTSPLPRVNSTWGSSAPDGQAISTSVARAFAQPPVVGGFDHNGSRSGSSSRRHSVSVVGRRDLFAEGLGFGMTSPPGRGIGPLGFTDEELLPEQLGNALNLEIDQSRRRGVEIEVGRMPRFEPEQYRDRSALRPGPGPIGAYGPRPFAPAPPRHPAFNAYPARPPSYPTYQPQPYFQGSPPASPSFSSLSLSDLGRGLPLATLGPTTPLYIVTFKAGRRDVYYCPDPTLLISNGDRVIVEADRGSDLGTVVFDQLTPIEVREWQERQATAALLSGAREHQPPGMAVLGRPAQGPRVSGGELSGADLSTLLGGVGGGQMDSPMGSTSQGRGPLAKEIMPKRIFAKSSQGPEEQQRMMEKLRDEQEALVICREKAAQRGMPMQIVDAEYQWDRRKLTFYFKADKRIDFRDLTKENFRIFKSRIWMAMVPKDDPRG